MWRWVTRGFVLALLGALLAPALTAQVTFVGDVEKPDPAVTQSGMILVQGWALDLATINKIDLYFDDQYLHNLVLNLSSIDIVKAFPSLAVIHISRTGVSTGFSASRFTN